MIVVGAVGLNGSGKDALIKYLHERYGLPMLSIGDLVRDMAASRGILPTRSNLHQISQQAIEEYGADFFAKNAIARIEEEPWDAVGIAGIRTPADVRTFRERYGDNFVRVYVRVAEPRTRFERLRKRGDARDPESYERFLRQDQEEKEMFRIEEAVEEADITIDNSGSLEEFHREIDTQVARPVLAEEGLV